MDNKLTMLTIVMDKRVGTGHLILFADNSTTAEDGGSPMHAEERLADAGIWDTMTQGRQMAANHPPAKMLGRALA